MSKESKMPSLEELRERYGPYLSDPGFQTAADRALPNTGKPTDEEEILSAIEQEDDEAFLENLRKRIRETTPGL